jgi:signal transduction histidine kinase
MILDGDVIGYMGIAFDRDHPDPPNTVSLDLCQTLAQQATLAIRLSELAEQARAAALANERERGAEARAHELSEAAAAIRRTGHHLTASLNLTSFVQEVLREATHQTGAQSSALYRWNAEDGTLGGVEGSDAAPSCHDVPPEWKQNWQRLLGGEPVLSTCTNNGRTEFVLAVPVLLGAQLLGLLCLSFPESKPATCKIELLQALAQQTAVAIHLRDLAGTTLRSAVLEERASLARELHDTLLQGFTGVTLQLRALLRRPPESRAESQERLARIEGEATEAVQSARRAVGDMRGGSPMFARPEPEELVADISDLIRQFKLGTEAALLWQVKGRLRELPSGVSVALLRIVREAVSNALRHAQPDTVSVTLRYESRHVHLVVHDDGCGFVVGEGLASGDGHFGLIGMRERAESVGGILTISSQPGNGATIQAQVPA